MLLKIELSKIILSEDFSEKQKSLRISFQGSLFCDPAGIRTQDPYIKSVMLYQLSYEILSILRYFP